MDAHYEQTMWNLSNILYNASQPESNISRDQILDSIKNMLQEYNNVYWNNFRMCQKVSIVDFRK